MTSGRRVLSETGRDEVLRAACERGEELEILVGRDGRVIKHSSRFLRAVTRDDGLHLLIEMPTQEGKSVDYRQDEELEILFHLGGERYAFSSHIEGQRIHGQNAEQDVTALLLRYPREVENRQRRGHYRVPLSMAKPVSVAFVEDLGPDASSDVSSIYSGFISNISAGGLAIACRQSLPVSIEEGTHLIISFQLPGEPEHLDLKGVIRHIRHAHAGQAPILGIEYLRDEHDIRGPRKMSLIQRFVVERQRKILQQLRMLQPAYRS